MKNKFSLNSNGVSLLEAMIAVFLLTIMMLGATRAMMVLTDEASLSVVRDESNRIASQVLTDAVNTSYPALVGVVNTIETRQFGNTEIDFNVQQTVVTEVVGVAKSVTVVVSWLYRGRNYSQTKSGIVGNI